MHSMAQGNNDDNDTPHIPSFAHALAPYIRPRQEALRIRQVLTTYLRSQITFSSDDASHLALCVPNDAIDVKHIPAEVTGLRRAYLTALQENLAAKREYRSASENIGSRRLGPENEKGDIPDSDPSSNLQAYLELRRGRQRHAKLQVFRHYLEELKARDAGPDLETQMGSDQSIMLPGMEGRSSDDKREDIEDLVHRLEKAVLRAKSQLDREKKLLEEVKAEREPGVDHTLEVSPSAKAQGLGRIRNELVQWVEDKLTSMGGNEDTPLELPPEELENSARLLEDRKGEIAAQYAAYIDARKRLLNAASSVCQPVETPPTKSQCETTDYDLSSEEPAVHPIDAVSFASENLLPLSKTHRALALQKSYQTGMLAKEKLTTLRMLNRSGDESHLLPEYPILAREPRFKNAASALRQTSQSTGRTKDEILSMAEAWAFASDAAGGNEREYVEGKIAQGGETARDAERVLGEVYGMLNQDLGVVLQDGEKAVEDDTWAPGTPSTKSRRAEAEGRTRGPWAGLNGWLDVT